MLFHMGLPLVQGAKVTLLIGEGEGAALEVRQVVLAEGQLPDAVEQAVLKMKKGA